MSFLGDIVNSIGGNKEAAPSLPTNRPRSVNSDRSGQDLSKPGSRTGILTGPSPLNGTKRKAEDVPVRSNEKVIKPNPVPGLTSSVSRRLAAPPLSAPRVLADKLVVAPQPVVEKVTQPKNEQSMPIVPTVSGPAPARGSYADIMARAKQAAESKHSKVGLIKHQTTTKEKSSKLSERRRDDQGKMRPEKCVSRTGASGKSEKRRSISPVKRKEAAEPKAPRPPLNAPQSKYQGTMGTTSSRSARKRLEAKKARRNDEYLGTDEEDNSDSIDDDDDNNEQGYESNASSDMEAGAFDIDMEEAKAVREARAEDAREAAVEAQLRREKDERRKRLESLANKRK